jgi:dTDP-4-dehydrorhamnose reductase
VNSISHRGEFVRACLDLWEKRAPLGTYNITNPGVVSTREVVELIKRTLHPKREFAFFENDQAFYQVAKAPRSNCIMDTSKLTAAGIQMRPVEQAIEQALRNWIPAKP